MKKHLDMASLRSRSKPKPKRPPPVKTYPAGYFLALVRRHDWPRDFACSLTDAEIIRAAREAERAQISTTVAERKLGHAGRDIGLIGSLRNGGVTYLGAK